MAIRSGLGSQIGLSTESAWGTYTAPNRWPEYTSESIRRTNNYVRTAGLRSGRLGQSSALHSLVSRTAAGEINADVQWNGWHACLCDKLNGNANAPTTPGGGTTSREFSFDIGLTVPDTKGLGVQVGRPDVGGTTRAFSYLGGKVTQVTWQMERGGVLAVSAGVDFKDEDVGQTLGTPSYAATNGTFVFSGGSAEFDDVVVTDCIRSASITYEAPMDNDRFCFGTSGVKKEQVNNGLIAVTASLEMEFSNMTQHTAFTAATRRKFEFNNTGPIIEAALAYACNFTLPATVTTGEGPVVEGPDVLTQTITLEAVLTSSNPLLNVLLRTTDTAL